MRRALEAHIFARFPEVSDLLAPYAVSTHAAFATKYGLDPRGNGLAPGPRRRWPPHRRGPLRRARPTKNKLWSTPLLAWGPWLP